MQSTFQWPIQWLFGSNTKKLDAIDLTDNSEPDEMIKKLDWRKLYRLGGWENSCWQNIEHNVPNKPGIYVIAHEEEKPPLYVGMSENLRSRILNAKHHKISKILETYSRDTGFPVYYNSGGVEYEIIVFWKAVEEPYYNNSLVKTLIWYEALTIGMLCPFMQGDIKDLDGQEWSIGTRYFT